VPLKRTRGIRALLPAACQLTYNATGPGQSATVRVHNDSWVESTFDSSFADLEKAEVVFDPEVGQNVCRMSGNRISWEAYVQTWEGVPVQDDTNYENATVRILLAGGDPLDGGNIAYDGARGRVTLRAGVGDLHITAAYIMQRASGVDGVPETVRGLTFTDAVGAGTAASPPPDVAGVTGPGVVIPAGGAAISDLFDLPIDRTKDYLVSLHVGPVTGTGRAICWKDSTARAHAFLIENDAADLSGVADWSAVTGITVDELPRVVAVESLFVTHPETATYTSQVYDTRMSSPSLAGVTWRADGGTGNSVVLRVRSASQPDMSDALDWQYAPEFSDPVGANSLAVLTPGRYVQWHAVFGTQPPHLETAKLLDVAVLWPGVRRGVDIGVTVEQGPEMGICQLLVDDLEPSPAALRMSFSISKDVRGEPYTKTFAVEASPRN